VIDRAFEVESILLGESVAIMTGTDDPAVSLVPAPVGSIYLRDNGELWRKLGPLDNGWVVAAFGSGTVSPATAHPLMQDYTSVIASYTPTGMYADLAPNSSYWFGGYFIFASTNANSGVGFAFGFDGSVINFGALTIIPTGNSTTVLNSTHHAIGQGSVSNTVGTPNRQYFANTAGSITTGALGGRFEVLFRPETTQGATLYRGSALKLEKLL